MVSILRDLRLADACTMVPAPHRHHFIISHSITSSASLEVSGSYNAKNMIIIINVVLVNVKTLLVMFCIMSPSCLQFSTLALPHHACHKEGLEENTLKRQSWISNFEKWWKWKVQNKFRNYISIRLPLLRPRWGPTFISQRCQRCQALQHRRERWAHHHLQHATSTTEITTGWVKKKCDLKKHGHNCSEIHQKGKKLVCSGKFSLNAAG